MFLILRIDTGPTFSKKQDSVWKRRKYLRSCRHVMRFRFLWTSCFEVPLPYPHWLYNAILWSFIYRYKKIITARCNISIPVVYIAVYWLEDSRSSWYVQKTRDRSFKTCLFCCLSGLNLKQCTHPVSASYALSLFSSGLYSCIRNTPK